MDICNSDVIRESILTIVNTQIEQQELKEQLLHYVDYQSQNGFSFGELLILHYNTFNGEDSEEIYTVAAAVEILILSFDILDDIEDADSADKPWSIEPDLALNATTILLFISAKVMIDTSFPNKGEAISILLKYALQSINGQHKDLLNICRTEADYMEMTLEKSGSLTELACLIGAVLATKDYPKEVKAYAGLIGLICQINNDLTDIATRHEKNDLINKKYTLPIIYLLNNEDDELQIIRDYYDGKTDIREVVKKQQLIDEKIIETGAITYTEVMKRIQQNKALTEVKKLTINQAHFNQLKKYIY